MIEQPARWRKSSYSQGQNDCVEVAPQQGAWLIRDSKCGECGQLLTVSAASWAAMMHRVHTEPCRTDCAVHEPHSAT